MKSIAYNPYIVGNPIKSREMFFGREDDFQYVAKKIGEGRSNQILVLCGERRSGKTSILFQILGGRLGSVFLPILIDLQMLAGIKGDRGFFSAILKTGCGTLKLPGLGMEELDAGNEGSSVERLFESFLASVREKAPGKITLFLLDEYELIEAKIRDGTLSESTVHYLAGILESPFKVSFIFTGSTNLEDRKVELWKTLLGKSIYRKISYLSRRDTVRLITEPLGDSVSYPEEVVESVYRLTGGQPFYTQVICQNMTDLLIEEKKGDPAPSDLERIVREIVDNPLPQMIYSWNSLSEWDHIILASLAGRLADPLEWTDGPQVLRFIKDNRIVLPFKKERVNVLLEDGYHQEFLEKSDSGSYRFKMDLFRVWIRREHSIWKAAKEAGLEFRRGFRPALTAVSVAAGLIALLAAAWFLLLPRFLPGFADWARLIGRRPPQSAAAPPAGEAEQVVSRVTVTANRGPFRLKIDGQQTLTSEGQADPLSIEVPSLRAGLHTFVASLPSGETVTMPGTDVSVDRRTFAVRFPPAKTKPASREQVPQPTPQAAASKPAAEETPRVVPEETAAAQPQEQTPQEQAPAEPVEGILIFTTKPSGAELSLDGQPTGQKTPFAESVSPGEHVIGVRLEGFKPQTFTVSVKSGTQTKHEVTLVESWAWLSFDVRPRAEISLDGAHILDTPYAKPYQVRAGLHTLTIANDALKVKKTIPLDLKDGETLQIKEVLE